MILFYFIYVVNKLIFRGIQRTDCLGYIRDPNTTTTAITPDSTKTSNTGQVSSSEYGTPIWAIAVIVAVVTAVCVLGVISWRRCRSNLGLNHVNIKTNVGRAGGIIQPSSTN
jgi:hypothetical protein